jgi:surfeit locus 1 family protein
VTRSFPIIATLCTLLGAVVLCGLGTWQIQRLQWKQELLASIDAEYKKVASEHFLTIKDINSLKKNRILRGVIAGSLDHSNSVSVQDGKQGKIIYIPLRLRDGGAVLVKMPGSSNPDKELGDAVLVGMLKVVGKPWRFGIKNDLEGEQWAYLDLDDVRAYTGIEALPQVVFHVEHRDGVQERYTPNNKHLQYAIFWFTMCMIMLLIYYARFWKDKSA